MVMLHIYSCSYIQAIMIGNIRRACSGLLLKRLPKHIKVSNVFNLAAGEDKYERKDDTAKSDNNQYL